MRIHAKHYATGEIVEVVCSEGVIRSVAALSDPSRPTADLTAGWVAPAFFDLQINGCDGIGFSSSELTADGVRQIVTACHRHGISGLCPTVITNSFQALEHGFTTLRRCCETDVGLAAAMPVFHLEGPYISPEDGPRGAHPRQHVRPPDWQEFQRLQDAAGGRIRLVTLAPEHDGALNFIERLVNSGVVVAIGHTTANSNRIREAITAGARLSTHLGNGIPAQLPRHDNCIWAQLAADELWASIICDGYHLPPAVIQCFLRVKTPARTILTCDAGNLAGMPPGRYREWEQDLEVLPEGKIVVVDSGYLAGSYAFTDLCVGNAIRHGGVKLYEAVDMAGARPRELLGLPPRRLQAGDPADLVLFDWEPGGEFRVRTTLNPSRER